MPHNSQNVLRPEELRQLQSNNAFDISLAPDVQEELPTELLSILQHSPGLLSDEIEILETNKVFDAQELQELHFEMPITQLSYYFGLVVQQAQKVVL